MRIFLEVSYKRFIFFVLSLILAVSTNTFTLDVGEQAPCVVLDQQTVSGELVEGCIRDTIDEKQAYTLIEFFSIFCGACNVNLPKVTGLHETLSGKLQIRLVSLDRNIEYVQDYIVKHSDLIKFLLAFDNERRASRAYGIDATPTTFILDKNFNVVYKHVGVFSESDLKEIAHLVLK